MPGRSVSRRLGALALLVALAALSTGPFGSTRAHAAGAPGGDPVVAPGRIHVRLLSAPGGTAGGWLQVPGIGAYPGRLRLDPAGGHFMVVNEVSLEDYIRGISEMPRSWPLPALEAQAIAARTYGLYHVWTNAGDGPDICATDSCQVYRGVVGGDGASRWAAAVAATAGQVLLYRGRVIDAFYAASNGGQTRGGGVPWLPAVADPDDSVSPYHHWTWTAPVAAFAPVLGVQQSSLVAVATTADAVVATVRHPPSPDPVQQGTDPREFQLAANRRLASPPGLPLPLPGPYFSLTTQPSGVVQVEGWGFGHGLGMSQYGALGKARRGLSANAILSAYYGPARPTRLQPRLLPAAVRVLIASDRPSVTVIGSGPLQVVDDRGVELLEAPSGAVSVDPAAGGVRARAIDRPAVVDVPEPPPALHGHLLPSSAGDRAAVPAPGPLATAQAPASSVTPASPPAAPAPAAPRLSQEAVAATPRTGGRGSRPAAVLGLVGLSGVLALVAVLGLRRRIGTGA